MRPHLAAAAALSFVALSALTPSAHAEGEEAPPHVAVEAAPDVPQPASRPEVDHYRSFWRFEIGVRSSFVADPGLDPFAQNDYVPQFSLAASRTILARDRFSFAAGLAWDYGSRSEHARGDFASLSIHRLAVPLEGRMHFGPWGYAFVRAAPGVVTTSVSLEDAAAAATLTKDRALFAADFSAGYALLVHRNGPATKAAPRVWLQGEGGYGWTARERLDLHPDLADNDPRRAGGVDLGSLALRGPFFRIALAITY